MTSLEPNVEKMVNRAYLIKGSETHIKLPPNPFINTDADDNAASAGCVKRLAKWGEGLFPPVSDSWPKWIDKE